MSSRAEPRTGAADPRRSRERPCLHEHFEAQARRIPEAIAVACDGACLTYDRLNRRANRLARRLREEGVGAEELVALYLEPSLDTVVAILAVLKAGGAYVPLDPGAPPARAAFVLGDTRARVLVTTTGLAERVPADDARVVCLDREGDFDDHDLEPVAAPDNLAYVIYTSGSTGQPKGVLVEHRNVDRLFSATGDWLGPGAEDVWSLLHSYAFDFSVWEMWGALLHGGRLVVAPHTITRDPEALADLLVAEDVTVLNVTPSLFMSALEPMLARADQLSLRTVVFGGEALYPRSLRPWFERFGAEGPELVNMYGITETTVHVTRRVVTAADVERPGSPIGEPIADLELHLLDEQLRPVLAGEPGELYVGGAGVARGYLRRPELTAERFIQSPFGDGRLYRTGDRARRLRDGELEYLDRVDDQVKLRGFRIEPGEIRAALQRHPGISDAAVVLRGEGVEAELAAYVIAGSEPPASHELRRFLAELLPEHMVPATFTFLTAFPLTANGKLDAAALPEPVRERPGHEAVAPRSKLERRLLAIWRRELGIRSIGVTDHLLDLGVNSLAAARLLARTERKLGVRLPAGAIFRAPTVEALARMLEQERDAERWTSLVPMQTGGSRPPLFCLAPGEGLILPFGRLARHLGEDQPVYALQPPGLHGEEEPLATVEALASHYLDEMRDVGGRGPWCLCGLCFGAIVAYEIAQRLLADGEEVALLALFNAPTPAWMRTWGWYGAQPHIAALAPPRLTGTRRLARALREPRRLRNALAYHADRVRLQVRGALRLPAPLEVREKRIHDLAYRAHRSYEPRPYDGELLLLLGAGLFEEPDLGWAPLARGGVRTLLVPGAHTKPSQMLAEPEVRWTAEQLGGRLAAIAAQESQPKSLPTSS